MVGGLKCKNTWEIEDNAWANRGWPMHEMLEMSYKNKCNKGGSIGRDVSNTKTNVGGRLDAIT